MLKIDDETADELINRLDQVNVFNIRSDNHFRDDVMGQMKNTFAARPWIMCLALYVYGAIFLYLNYISKRQNRSELAWHSNMNDRLAKFKFASEFGRLTDSAGRTWFFEYIRLSNINKIDAAFLTWSGVIQIRRQKISLCRFDSISGYFMMMPLYMLIAIASLVCFCDGISPAAKAFQLTAYLGEIIFLFKFYKSMSFDVYKVASKYYVTDSWLGEPSLRTLPN